MLNEFIKFFSLTLLIVIISKYLLANYIRKLAYTTNLSSPTIGQISGIATSFPELLSVIFSASIGMIKTGFFNIFSSNLINVILFISSLLIAKNFIFIRNKKFYLDYIIIGLTTLFPLILIFTKSYNYSITIPLFFILFLLFLRIKQLFHKDILVDNKVIDVKVKLSSEKKRKRILWYSFVLLIACILLFLLGNELSKSLEILFLKFNVPEFLLGSLLGIFTSIPELVTFMSAQKHYNITTKKRFYGVLESLNNLSMSNIMNLFFIQPIGMLIYIIYNYIG